MVSTMCWKRRAGGGEGRKFIAVCLHDRISDDNDNDVPIVVVIAVVPAAGMSVCPPMCTG